MDWKLELVVVPVPDVDRARRARSRSCATRTLRDRSRLHLIVTDIDAARAELVERGADPSEPFHFEPTGQVPGPDPDRRDYGTFLSFSVPDGNSWLVQEVGRTA